MRKLSLLVMSVSALPGVALAAPGDPGLTAVPPEQRLNLVGVVSHAKPLVMLVIVLLLAAVIRALWIWITAALKSSRPARAASQLSAIAAGAPLLGLAAAAYGLMDSCIGLANVRPVPSLSILAPGLAEAFFCIMLGALAGAIAGAGGRHLRGQAETPAVREPVAPRPASTPLARATA